MENKRTVGARLRNAAVAAVLFAVVPALIAIGVWVFKNRNYKLISVLIAVASCVPFFVRFESGKRKARELVMLAAMTALSVLGRIVFSPFPGFKPVTAVVIITGIAFGPEAGFITGSGSAILSNMYFGHGPWTPFQMFSWGLIGFISGVIFRKNKMPAYIPLIIIGIAGGVFFSLLMDVWTALSVDGEFIFARYLTFVASSFSFTVTYAVSNVFFLVILARPILKELARIRVKYGVFYD